MHNKTQYKIGGENMTRLENKVAIVTGGASGIGAAIVKRFLEEGAQVVFTDLNEEGGNTYLEELKGDVRFMTQDVSQGDQWDQVIEFTKNEFGPINVLVNNAGISVTKHIEDLTAEEFHRVIAVNLDSIFYSSKKVVPSMKEAGIGSIINVSSIAGIVGGHGQAAYSASKFGVRGLTKSTAADLAKYNIRSNSILPGVIKTPILDTPENQEVIKSITEAHVMGRIGDPVEIANTAVFLASDESSYINGTEIVVDGGTTAII